MNRNSIVLFGILLIAAFIVVAFYQRGVQRPSSVVMWSANSGESGEASKNRASKSPDNMLQLHGSLAKFAASARTDSGMGCIYSAVLLKCSNVEEAKRLSRAPMFVGAQISETRKAVENWLSMCDGINPEVAWSQAANQLRQAAEAGNLNAMLRYARGDLFSVDYSKVGTDEFIQWKKTAEELLWSAFKKGYRPVIPYMIRAYSGDETVETAAIPDNIDTAYALQLLMASLQGNRPPSPQYSDVNHVEASRLAQQWGNQYFKGQGSGPLASKDLLSVREEMWAPEGEEAVIAACVNVM